MNLLTQQNAKTTKGEKYGYKTYILYMAPHKQNSFGKNLCPNASKGCVSACLFTSGRGKMSNVKNARIKKANYFIENRKEFLNNLHLEVTKINKKKSSLIPCIRLNGTTDIPWENFDIIQKNPNIMYYDYSKSKKRVLQNNLKNYHLVFSRSETNNEDCREILRNNKSIAVVVTKELKNRLLIDPTINYNLVDGDLHDLIFKHAEGSIILLKSKGDGNKDTTGFVIKDYNEFKKQLL